MEESRGLFVALCGLDGAGKSVMIQHVNEKLGTEKKIINIKHPPDEWLNNPKILAAHRDQPGEKMDDMDEIYYTTGLRIKEQNNVIIPELLKGNMVLSHRYIYSMFTYYAARKTVPLSFIAEITKDIILPDITFYLRINPEESIRRISKRDEFRPKFQMDINYLNAMVECYEKMAKAFNFVLIDTMKCSIDRTFNEIMSCIVEKRTLKYFDKICMYKGEFNE